MPVIDADGLFNGDRLRQCSNLARLYWPYLYLASNGFGRLELNYFRVLAKAFYSFRPPPSEQEFGQVIREYIDRHLLFPYMVIGQLWGQWDTPGKYLPDYKTRSDLNSPAPPEEAFSRWLSSYRSGDKPVNGDEQNFENILKGFPYGVVVGVVVGKNQKHVQPEPVQPVSEAKPVPPKEFALTPPASQPGKQVGLEHQQAVWFEVFWKEYWRRVARKPAEAVFQKRIRTQVLFERIMAALRKQKPSMLAREADRRPHAATWINQDRWNDEEEIPAAEISTKRGKWQNL